MVTSSGRPATPLEGTLVGPPPQGWCTGVRSTRRGANSWTQRSRECPLVDQPLLETPAGALHHSWVRPTGGPASRWEAQLRASHSSGGPLVGPPTVPGSGSLVDELLHGRPAGESPTPRRCQLLDPPPVHGEAIWWTSHSIGGPLVDQPLQGLPTGGLATPGDDTGGPFTIPG